MCSACISNRQASCSGLMDAALADNASNAAYTSPKEGAGRRKRRVSLDNIKGTQMPNNDVVDGWWQFVIRYTHLAHSVSRGHRIRTVCASSGIERAAGSAQVRPPPLIRAT